MSPYDEAAAAFLEAAAPVAAYCQRTARPNKHADQLDTLLLRASEFGEQADQLQKGYEGSQHIRDLCAGIRERIGHLLLPQVPEPLRPLAGSLTSHCLMPPLHARATTQPLRHDSPGSTHRNPEAHPEGA